MNIQLRQSIIGLLGAFMVVGAVMLAVRAMHSQETPPVAGTVAPQPRPTPASTQGIFDSGVPKNAIPSIDAPTFSPVAQAVDELGGEGSGLAVVKGTIARFYPYQILFWHEVVNDKLGGTPIAATYCALCNVGVVYERVIDGQEYQFGVSGKIHELDSLLYDRTTESLWSQVTGEAVEGPMFGLKLAVVESTAMTLQEFAAQYPRGQVLSKFTGYVRNYDSLSYGDYATRLDGDTIISRKGLIHPKTEVIGIEVAGKYKAYPLEIVQRAKSLTDSIEGIAVQVASAGESIEVRAVETKELIPHAKMHWFMWQLYRPESQLYKDTAQ